MFGNPFARPSQPTGATGGFFGQASAAPRFGGFPTAGFGATTAATRPFGAQAPQLQTAPTPQPFGGGGGGFGSLPPRQAGGFGAPRAFGAPRTGVFGAP